MAIWRVKTYYKKSCEQHEHFLRNGGKGKIIVKDGFRFCEFEIETSDDNPPQFEFTEVPGGNGAKDSVDLYSCCENNIESSEMIEMFDGGCWGDIEFEDIDEDEEDKLREFIEENGAWSLEDEGEWYLDETECWVWGPLEITDEDGNVVHIIEADDEGNVAIKTEKDYE